MKTQNKNRQTFAQTTKQNNHQRTNALNVSNKAEKPHKKRIENATLIYEKKLSKKHTPMQKGIKIQFSSVSENQFLSVQKSRICV